MMARIPWRWEDPVEGTVAMMPINPNAGASPKYSKSLTKKTTTAPGTLASPLIFEGADAATQFDFSGAILTEDHYQFLLKAWQKRHPVRVTDDLGRTFTIYIESFSPERKLSRTHPWRHSYQATAVVVE
jgi:hypothetical protein